jgi:3-carboxy-cis,cis-muconate cycloisomerase
MFDRLFTTPKIDSLVSDEALLAGMLRFESALASVQADLGLIPPGAATVIGECCSVQFFDLGGICRSAERDGNPAIPLVKVLGQRVKAMDVEAARYVHFGATSQDVIDTGLMLCTKKALDTLVVDLIALEEGLIGLIERNRRTFMPGRTLLQHARPISFGLKVAGWLDGIVRCRKMLEHGAAKSLAVQFGGAVGSLAASGPKGLQILEGLARKLDLTTPELPWHTQRDRIGRLGMDLALLETALAKMAQDVVLLMQTEVGEVGEELGAGGGGSSTLPHKQNPIAPTKILANAKRVPSLVSALLTSTVHEHERSVGGWHAEWVTFPELVRTVGGSVAHALDLVSGLKVHSERMRSNMELTNGLLFAENVSIELAESLGKSTAHEILTRASQKSRQTGQHLRAVLEEDPTLKKLLDPGDLDRLFSPEQGSELTDELIDRVLAGRSPCFRQHLNAASE